MQKIFSSKKRIKILKKVIFSEETLSVNRIADKLKISKGLVSKYMDFLVKAGVAKRSKTKYFIIDSATTKGAKIFLNIDNIDTRIFKKYKFVKAVGLYGSCAKGENTQESDIDLWIKIEDVRDEKISSLTAELAKKINKVKPLFLTTKKIEDMKKKDELFYHSLSFGSIVLLGEKDAI